MAFMMVESVIEDDRHEFCFVPNVREEYYLVSWGQRKENMLQSNEEQDTVLLNNKEVFFFFGCKTFGWGEISAN